MAQSRTSNDKLEDRVILESRLADLLASIQIDTVVTTSLNARFGYNCHKRDAALVAEAAALGVVLASLPPPPPPPPRPSGKWTVWEKKQLKAKRRQAARDQRQRRH